MARCSKRRLPLAWLALSLCFVTPPAAEAQVQEGDTLRGVPDQDGPVEVKIGFQLIKITDVDEREETIDFEGGIYLMWKDPRQAYDAAAEGLPDYGFTPGNYQTLPPRLYQGDFAVKEIFVGWRPQVRINNGIGDRVISYMAVGVWPDGMVIYTDQFHTRAETPMALRAYPFDTQRLEIFVSPYALASRRVKLTHAPFLAGSSEQDSGIADWEVLGIDLAEETTDLEMLDGTDRTYSQLVVGIGIERRPGHILFSIILPLLILVALSWSIFWMDEESISDRVNISFVGILSVVAYYFVVQDSIPQIHYPTMMDAFMIATFMILAGTVVVSFVVNGLNRSGRKELGDRVDRVCRWAFPVGYTVVTGLVVLYFSAIG